MQDGAVVTDDPYLIANDLHAVKILIDGGIFWCGGSVGIRNRRGQSNDQANAPKEQESHEVNSGHWRNNLLVGTFAVHSMEPPRMMLSRVARLNMVAE